MNARSAGTPRKMNLGPVLAQGAKWLAALAGTVGVGWLLIMLAGFFHPKVSGEAGARLRPIPEGAIRIEVEQVERPRYETAIGSVEPIHESSLSARLLSRIVELNVTAGQEVKANDVLVRLDDTDLKARMAQAEAAYSSAQAVLTQATSSYQRAQALRERETIPQAELDRAESAFRTAEAEVNRLDQAVKEAAAVLDYATIRAPFDGIIVDKRVESGDTVVPGQILLTLYDPTRMQLVASVREGLASRLSVGQQVAARLESLDHECDATISEVVPQASEGSRSFLVKVTGPCPPGIYSGVFGRLLIPLDNETVTLIPAAAIRRVGQLTMVDVVDGERVRRQMVRLGRSFDGASVAPGVPGGNVEVLSGVRPGDTVLVFSDTEVTP
ncbi:MAG: efflux RND transporter periplasmic adaptor subunit [Planctomycetales bacterium]|nr:efflux RND transporter periplasmic adaptor subunit [Planctomycetales bacterium]